MNMFLILFVSIVACAENWIDKHVPTPIEYTVFNEVSIVHSTKMSFDDFYKSLEKLAGSTTETTFNKTLVRECLAKYLYPLIVIDPIKPGDEHLYNAEYEHKKEVFGHKVTKDFIMRTKKETFTKEDMQKWFQASPSKGDLKQPQVKNSNQILDYLNSLIISQINYILDIIEQNGLDFFNAG